MRHRFLILTGPVVAVILALSLACSDGPLGTERRSIQVAGQGNSSGRPENPTSRPTMHYARVAKFGELVDGTATSATRDFAGVYRVTFPESVVGCAGTVSPAIAFPGSAEQASAPIVGNVRMGFEGRDDEVGVEMAAISSGTQSTAFFLVLVCPSR